MWNFGDIWRKIWEPYFVRWRPWNCFWPWFEAKLSTISKLIFIICPQSGRLGVGLDTRALTAGCLWVSLGQVLDLVEMCWFCLGHKLCFVIHAGRFRCTYVNYFTWGQILVLFILSNALFSFPISAKLNFASERYFMYQFFKWLNVTHIKSGLSVIIMFIISNAYIIALEKNNKKIIKCYKKYFIIPIKMLHNLAFWLARLK